MSDVRFNMRPFDKLVSAVELAGAEAASTPLTAMFTAWGGRYMAFTRRRYLKFSRGGGDWAPLAESTKARRRKPRRGHVGSRSMSILIDTRTLFNALTAGSTGNLSQVLKNPGGIRVGFAEGVQHGMDGITIRKLAVIHDQGLGNVPKRTILVPPDKVTENGMMKDAGTAMQDIMRRLAI